MFGMVSIRFWPGLYMRVNTESYKDLGDKKPRASGGPIFYCINRSNILRYSPVDETLNAAQSWLIKMSWNGCFHIGPVTGPRPVVLAIGWLYWPEAQYSNPQANTTALGPVTRSLWKHPFNNIMNLSGWHQHIFRKIVPCLYRHRLRNKTFRRWLCLLS